MPDGNLSVDCRQGHGASSREAADGSRTTARIAAPTAITDIPVTIADAAGRASTRFPGIPALKLAEDAPRRAHVRDVRLGARGLARELLRPSGPSGDSRVRSATADSWTLRDVPVRAGRRHHASRFVDCYEPQRSSSGVVYRWSATQRFSPCAARPPEASRSPFDRSRRNRRR